MSTDTFIFSSCLLKQYLREFKFVKEIYPFFAHSGITLHDEFQTTQIVQRKDEEKKANKSDNEEEDDHDHHDSKEQRLTLMEEVISFPQSYNPSGLLRPIFSSVTQEN